jgi:hypothetical protein
LALFAKIALSNQLKKQNQIFDYVQATGGTYSLSFKNHVYHCNAHEYVKPTSWFVGFNFLLPVLEIELGLMHVRLGPVFETGFTT